MKKTLRDLAELVGGEVLGDAEIWISGITGIDEAGPAELTFAVPPHLDRAAASRAGAVIVPASVETYAKSAIRAKTLGSPLPVC